MNKKNNKIPKIIHYCWFGGKQMPDETKKFIETWRKFCPDFKIKEWNETNFDINSNQYVKEAYESKKWAFVSDYVRLYAMYNEGGIYLDTDVEVIKPLDKFLDAKAFSCFETNSTISTGIMGSIKGFPLFKEFLKYYDNRHFIKEDGKLDLTTNVETITKICLKHNLRPNGKLQVVEDLTIYPSEYFSPKDLYTEKIKITDNTYTIHHFSGTWIPESERGMVNIRIKIYKIFGKKLGGLLYKIIYFIYTIIRKFKELGFKKAMGYTFKKIKAKFIKS